MRFNNKGSKVQLHNIVVIGGGRWARVIVDVLCGIVPSSVKISVHSRRNVNGMLFWVSERGLKYRVQVTDELPKFTFGEQSAVIVANAAYDHKEAVDFALSNGVPVLVEKPLTLSFDDSQGIVDFAKTHNIYIAAAHVFLFSRYVDFFSSKIRALDCIKNIRVIWTDPRSERRYGESKRYDPGLPIYADWLPHIVSLLATFSDVKNLKCKDLEFYKGGAHLKISLILGDITCSLELERNGFSRQRVIEVSSDDKSVSLDFSDEPGTVYSEGRVLCGDPEWDSQPRPVRIMLDSFLRGAAGGDRDSRLDIDTALNSSKIIDQISILYKAALIDWLKDKDLKSHVYGVKDNNDIHYALCEILHTANPHSTLPFALRLQYLSRYVREASPTSLSKFLNNPLGFVQRHFNQK